ncbi:MAG: hypothetical protein OXC84_10095 [Gammaproteobacteria bacterium]|nr:hypothetical protein [Gammaproteobacteria bacterium]
MYKNKWLIFFFQLLFFGCLFKVSILLADEWAGDIPAGNSLPGINAIDQHGKSRTNDDLSGKNGLVFFFVRSSDW